MSKIPDVPSTENVPDGPLAWLKNWLDQVRLWVQTRDPRATRVGDPLDKFPDRRELVDLGILRRSSDGTFRPGDGFGGGSTIVVPGGGGGGGGPDFSDLTPPPAPTGLTAVGGIVTLQLAWDAPIYTQGRGNGQTNIYGAVWEDGTSKPTLGDPRTKRIDSAMEATTLHSYPTQPATRWVVWIKFQTRNGVEGPPSLSAEVTTGQDVAALLEILTGQIRESHLYSILGTRISLIDAADTVAGSVAARVKAERDERIHADDVMLEGAFTYTDTHAYAKDDGEQVALALSGLSTQVNDPTTGLPATRAKLLTEYATIAGPTNSLASATTSLQAFAMAAASARAGAMNADPGCTLPAAWILTGGAELGVTSSSTAVGRGLIRFPGTALNSMAFSAEAIPINPARRYSLTARLLGASDRNMYVTVRMFRADNSEVDGAATGWGGSFAGYVFGGLPTVAWTERGADFGAGTSLGIPADVAYVRVGVWGQYSGGGSSSSDQYAQDVRLVDVTEARAAKTEAVAAAENYTNSYAYAKITGEALAGTVSNLSAVVRAASLALPFEAWTLNGQGLATNLPDGKVGSAALRLWGNGGYPNQGNFIPLDRTKKYRVRFWARPSPDATGVLYFSLRQFTAPNPTMHGPDNGGRSPYKPSGWTRAMHESAFGAGQWGEYSYIWSSSDWQAGVQFVQPEFLDNYSFAAGYWDVQDFRMEEVTAFESLSATVQDVTTAQADPVSGNLALASRTSTLEASVTSPTIGNNPTYAALQTEQTARAALDGAVQALYTLRAEVSAGGSTMVGGWGLSATATAGAGPRISFGVRANDFYVGAPNDGSAPGIADVLPFIIQATPTTINGVAVPAGTYIADAFIRNGTITNVKIANAAIDDAKVASLSAAKLTAGSIAVGAYIQATNYVSGTSGWRISGNGTAEFSGVIVRGTIIATAGSIGGNTIDSTGVQSPGYTAGSTGWRLDTSGLVRAFASGGARVLDMAATGAAPVLKIGSALELLANGNAYFGGQLAVGSVSANGSTTSSASFPSLPNSTSTFRTGAIAFSPAASITGVGGNISAWVSCDVRVAAESTAVEAIRVFAYLYRNGAQVDSSEVFLRACAFPDATGATRTVAAEVTLLSPLEPLTGAQVFTLGFDVKFYNAAGAVVSPGPTAFTSYLQVISRANLQEIKV